MKTYLMIGCLWFITHRVFFINKMALSILNVIILAFVLPYIVEHIASLDTQLNKLIQQGNGSKAIDSFQLL